MSMLAFSANALAETGVQCVPTGMEAVSTDQESYPPGETAHISGGGFAPACDVELRITRPDGVAESAAVTTDVAGTLSGAYALPPPPGVLGTYQLDALGLDGSVLASHTFTDGPEILDPDIAPGYVAGSGSRSFAIVVRNTGDTTHRCVRVTLPSGYSSISVPGSAASSGSFSSSVSGQVITSTNTTGIAPGGWARLDVQATAPASNTSDWQLRAWSNTGCSSNATSTELVQVVAGTQPTDRRYSAAFVDADGAVTTPTVAPATAASFRIKMTKSSDSQSNKIEYFGIAVPRCFTGLSVTSAGENSANSNDWDAAVVDNFIRWRDPGSGELDDGQSVTITFGANTAGCASGSHSFWTVGWQDNTGSTDDAAKLFTTSAHPTMTVAVLNTAPSVAAANASVTVDEGQTALNSGTWSDPDAGQTVTLTASAGTVTKNADGTWSWSYATTDGPDESQTVTITASDGTASAATTFQLTVENVAPVVDLTGDDAANEGDLKTYTYTVSDPGDDLDPAVSESCGVNGTYTDTETANHFQCTFADGDASSNVSVTADDGDAAGFDSITVAIANIAPAVALTDGPQSVDESTSEARTYTYSISEPGDDTVSVETSCGPGGTKVPGSDAQTATSGSFECIFPDGLASSLVTAQATDSDGAAGNMATREVVVGNVAPAVAFTSGATEVDESTTASHAYSYSISDPGADDVSSVATDCGAGGTKVAGSDSNTNSGGTFECIFPDGPESSTVTAQATDDDLAAGETATRPVTIANVAPTVTFAESNNYAWSESTTDERTFNFSAADPGADTLAITPNCGPGTLVDGSATSTSFRCIFADGPAASGSEVSVSADDGDGGTASDSHAVTVSNVAPTVTLNGAATADEGDTETYTYTVFDPGADTWAADEGYPKCGVNGTLVDGSHQTTAAGGEFKCKFPDGPKQTEVAIKVTDDDGGSDTDSQAVIIVTIANVHPLLTAGPAGQSAAEGSSESWELGSFTDPGPDSPWTVSIAWGDGAVETWTADAPGDLSGTHAYADNGTYTVAVTVTDKDGGSDTKTFDVNVENVPPDVVVVGPASAAEGQTHLYEYSWTDPGDDTFPISGNSVDCGPKGTVSQQTFTPAERRGSFECTFSDDSGAGVFAITASVTDDDGGVGIGTQHVDVDNVPPAVAITSPAADAFTTVGTPVTVTATFVDQGTGDTHTCTIDGGPGTLTEANGSGTCQGTATPSGPGSFTITVVVTDDDGGSGSASVTVYALYAIYAHERCSGGFGKGLIANGSSMYVDGRIHSNGPFSINGSGFSSRSATIYRDASNGCKAVYAPTKVNFGPPSPTAPISEASARDWPRYFNRSEFTCTHPVKDEWIFNSSGTAGGPKLIPSGTYCANKVFKINGNNITGQITVLAPEIAINGRNIDLDPHAKGVLLFNVNLNGTPSSKEIVVDGDYSRDTTATLGGLIFNPGGGIKVNGKAIRLARGFLHGQWVELNGSGFRMEY